MATGIGRVFPVISAVASLYGVMLGHRGVTGPRGTGGLVWAAVTAAAYLAAGILAFRAGERASRPARRRGSQPGTAASVSDLQRPRRR